MKRILIIEDELEMLRNLTTILRLEKFRPLSAENGRVGVDLAKKQKPDLILCDVMMPGLDGYGVIAALRADAETVTIPFIFLTAKAEKLDIRAGMNLGADDYLTKPVAKADLLAAIHSRLERAVQQAVPEFKPNFRSAVPLEEVLGLTTRVAETLLWLTQGKTNGEIATILGNSESTVKKTCLRNFRKARTRNPNRSQLARSRSAQFAGGSPISLSPQRNVSGIMSRRRRSALRSCSTAPLLCCALR